MDIIDTQDEITTSRQTDNITLYLQTFKNAKKKPGIFFKFVLVFFFLIIATQQHI